MKKIDEQAFIADYVKYESQKVLPGSVLKQKIDDHFVLSYNGDIIYVFADYNSAQKFVDDFLIKYFDNNRQQLIYIYKHFIDKTTWQDFVDWKSVINFISDKYDDIVGNEFKDDNKQAVLQEIKKDVKSWIFQICDDDGILSTFLFPFFDLKSIIAEIADGMEFRVYEHGSYFYVPKVKLP